MCYLTPVRFITHSAQCVHTSVIWSSAFTLTFDYVLSHVVCVYRYRFPPHTGWFFSFFHYSLSDKLADLKAIILYHSDARICFFTLATHLLKRFCLFLPSFFLYKKKKLNPTPSSHCEGNGSAAPGTGKQAATANATLAAAHNGTLAEGQHWLKGLERSEGREGYR